MNRHPGDKIAFTERLATSKRMKIIPLGQLALTGMGGVLLGIFVLWGYEYWKKKSEPSTNQPYSANYSAYRNEKSWPLTTGSRKLWGAK